MTQIFRSLNGEDVPLSAAEMEEYLARQAAYQAESALRLKAAIVDDTQAALDAFARTRGYDNILSACTYATSTVPHFASEGQRCVELRDQTWGALYELLADVEAGRRPVPSGFDDIKGELPNLAWFD